MEDTKQWKSMTLSVGFAEARQQRVELKYILGDDWEIIHIPTECIEKDATKIVTAIEKVLDYRYKLS